MTLQRHTVAVSRPGPAAPRREASHSRSEEHTSELQSPCKLVCRLLLEKKTPLELLDPWARVARLLLPLPSLTLIVTVDRSPRARPPPRSFSKLPFRLPLRQDACRYAPL